MRLSEGVLPVIAGREGYKAARWYVADDEVKAAEYARNKNWTELYKLLNTPFDEASKVAANTSDLMTAQQEKTIYAKWIPLDKHIITINYLDKATGKVIATVYVSGELEEGSAYQVKDQINKTINGYTWDSYKGEQTDAMEGVINQDLVYNVYYVKKSTSGGSTGEHGGHSGGHTGGSTTGGPGVVIAEEPVPMAPAPELVEIPEGETPLAALPKTGHAGMDYGIISLLSGMTAVLYLLLNRRKEEEKEIK